MTNFKEEQELEIEALTSIFEEGKEFEKISDTEFLLKLVPHPAGEEENHVGVNLHITYTPEYPESAPDWAVEKVKGLPEEKEAALKNLIEETIGSFLGMAMIYQLAEACQDYLKANNQKALSMHEEMMQRLAGEPGGEAAEAPEEEEGEDDDDFEDGPNAEEEEWRGLAEKPVCPEEDRITLESFAEWKAKFEQEMIATGVLKREEVKAKSGKEIFLEAAKSKDGGESKDGAAKGGDTPLVYDASLFGEDGLDDDLDDLDGLDED
mmetsp:Transcript_56968/g.128537  ORF Transcript_56968/g.128537 Transcript_56968/m.128537 type:complete len:265 (-) Transcript_56968:85-879(-)|eukprot:CAMPEP_0197883124 /NCGR_PEP_ID=MMETSP1439-20131203/10053_1 /TAXON_ID=66791 /ORGANISM="Gonyaulax spinifera, Strain CCMP409" /LENGTH=264 /DNA_ID=CAMNT_0043502829 /DNA_START=35 /DNA_END=829 /DNA_ORIENTATION=+